MIRQRARTTSHSCKFFSFFFLSRFSFVSFCVFRVLIAISFDLKSRSPITSVGVAISLQVNWSCFSRPYIDDHGVLLANLVSRRTTIAAQRGAYLCFSCVICSKLFVFICVCIYMLNRWWCARLGVRILPNFVLMKFIQ